MPESTSGGVYLPGLGEGVYLPACLVPGGGGVPACLPGPGGEGVYLPGPGGFTWSRGVPAWSGGVPGPGGCTWSHGGTCLVPGGCTCLVRGGVPAWSGGCTCLVLGGCTWSGTPPPTVDRMTHAYENITLPQTSFAGGNNRKNAYFDGKCELGFGKLDAREAEICTCSTS